MRNAAHAFGHPGAYYAQAASRLRDIDDESIEIKLVGHHRHTLFEGVNGGPLVVAQLIQGQRGELRFKGVVHGKRNGKMKFLRLLERVP